MECLEYLTIEDKIGNQHQVPCGKCGFCLVNKRMSWMFRIYHEMRNQLYPGWTLTMTYDERHVRRTLKDRVLSLRFKDIQLYIKRLRKAGYYCKYIAVGEYGSETNRPHYHMLIWTDASQQFLQDNWKSSRDGSILGRIHFDRITMQSAMYTMKYVIQPKQKVSRGIEKTRAQFSKGIGLSYLSTSVYEWHTFDYEDPIIFSYIDGRKVVLPRYYKNKIFTKYQMRKLNHENKCCKLREKREQIRQLIAQGVVDAEEYCKRIRSEQAQRVVNKTKHNQTI